MNGLKFLHTWTKAPIPSTFKMNRHQNTAFLISPLINSNLHINNQNHRHQNETPCPISCSEAVLVQQNRPYLFELFQQSIQQNHTSHNNFIKLHLLAIHARSRHKADSFHNKYNFNHFNYSQSICTHCTHGSPSCCLTGFQLAKVVTR